MRSQFFTIPLAIGLVTTVLATPLLSQGKKGFANFESPIHESLAVVQIAGNDYLLVCNAPDNSIEVWTASTTPSFVLRVPVGLEPVSVAVKPTPIAGATRCYSANWLGDSITIFDLSDTGNGLQAQVRRSVAVGDEPVGIAILPETNEFWTQPGGLYHEALFVTFSAPGNYGIFDPNTLAPCPSVFGGFLNAEELFSPGQGLALKDPRGIKFDPTATNQARLAVLNFRGGNTDGIGPALEPAEAYDFDLWVSDNLAASTGNQESTRTEIGNLGTTNFHMEFASNGDLYVCGIIARNNEVAPLATAVGEPFFQNLALNDTGFVRSFVARVDLSTTPPTMDILDTNDRVGVSNNFTGNQDTTPITMPTAVKVFGDGVVRDDGSTTTRVFYTGYTSDTLGVAIPGQGNQLSTLSRIDLSTANAFASNNLGGTMRGPRSLALRWNGNPGDPNALLFVYNRIEHSISVVDPNFVNPATAVLNTVALQFDPTPAYVRDGRKFLYSSNLSPGNVSCASCHIDGNTDFLTWNLSDGVAVPPEAIGNPASALGPNPAIKGPMLTQPLRGLVNFEVDDNLAQDLFYSNRPYHWRGDRGIFEDFNGAFVGLMAMPNSFSPTEGLPLAEMTQFREMTFSIHYPPNPDQPVDRRYSGTIGTADSPTDGTGALKGLKLFHQVPSVGNTSCVGCHSLPEGSNNRITEFLGFAFDTNLPNQGMETCQLKGLKIKQKRLIRYDRFSSTFTSLPSAANPSQTAEFGLTHTGLDGAFNSDESLSIPNFVNGIFTTFAPADRDLMAAYTREFDSGVAPGIGVTGTVDYALYNPNPPAIDAFFAASEQQADEANVGLVVHAMIGSDFRGFFYDVTDPNTPYHEVPFNTRPTIGPFTRQQLFNFIDDPSEASNSLIGYCTPLGTDRRMADLDGGAPSVSTVAPTQINLEGCRTMTANREVPLMTTNYLTNFGDAVGAPIALRDLLTRRAYQLNIQAHATGLNKFGLQDDSHDAPRRFVISGNNIDHGAVLRIWMPTGLDIAAAPSPGNPPPATQIPSAGTHWKLVEAPLFPTDTGNGLEWETAVEVDPLVLYMMMNGGPFNLPVITAFFTPWDPSIAQLINVPTPNVFDPLSWNWFYVEVQNDPNNPSTIGIGGWQRLTEI